MEGEEELAVAERRLQEILENTLDEVGEAEELKRQRAKQAFLEENVTLSAKSIKAEQHIQKVLNLVQKTTFWEFRVDYLSDLGAALNNARYVEILSVDASLIADAIAFMSVLASDWNENVRAAAVTQLANAAKSDDSVAVATLINALQDHTGMVRESSKRSLVRMTALGDENVISKVSSVLESYQSAVRESALQVILAVASVERAVDVVGELLAHHRTDLRIWALDALALLAFKTKQHQHLAQATRHSSKSGTAGQASPLTKPTEGYDQEGDDRQLKMAPELSPVSQLLHEGAVLMGRLSEKDSSVLLQDLKRSDSPIAHAVRARTPDLHAGLKRGRLSDSVEPQGTPAKSQGEEQQLQMVSPGNKDGGSESSDASMLASLLNAGHHELQGDCALTLGGLDASQAMPLDELEAATGRVNHYLYLECVMRKIPDSMHDPNWQVQRKALAALCAAVDLGFHDVVAKYCRHAVPVLYRKSEQDVLKFVRGMHERVKPEPNIDLNGQYYTIGQANSDLGVVKERMHKTESDIASTIAIFNALAPALGGPKQNKETYEVHKGTINGSSTALAADAQDVTRAWIPDMNLRRMDVILVGPQRRVVQVTDLVPLKGGFEIYGTDRYGNRVYIPANSLQRDHQFVLAAGERFGTFDGDRKMAESTSITTSIEPRRLPVISSVAARQLPRGHKFHTAAAFCGGTQLARPVPRRHESFDSEPHRSRNRFVDAADASPAFPRSMRVEPPDPLSRGPHYGYAGNRCFTPDARFTGIMDFLTQSPAHLKSSYTSTRLGTFFRQDLAANRKHYTDPLDHQQIPLHQSLLPEPAHVPRVTSPLMSPMPGNASISPNARQMEMGSRVATAGSPGPSRYDGSNVLNTAASRLNTPAANNRLDSPVSSCAQANAQRQGKLQPPSNHTLQYGSKTDTNQIYAETFQLDDLCDEANEFVTYQVPRADLPIGRPPSPKYTQSLKRGTTILTAARTKSFLHSVMDRQVQDMRSQTWGVGNFSKDIPAFHGPTPDQTFDKIVQDNRPLGRFGKRVSNGSNASIYGPRRLRSHR